MADPALWRPGVGDHVRVRGERPRACSEAPHGTEELGRVGIVVGDRPTARMPMHRYLVVFDRPVPRVPVSGRLVPLWVRHYTADELEPVED
jgi:hypothetical protein